MKPNLTQSLQVMLLMFTMLVVLSSTNSRAQPAKQKKYIVNGYVGGYRGLVDTRAIDAKKLTHINYAFVNVKDSMAWLTNLATDSINFRKLNELKTVNPELKILISIGGWAWSENFSDAVLTPSSRKLFAKTSAAIVQQYHLDGVDIDWEYPGMQGEEGNVYRPEDQQNFTLMFGAIRKELDSLQRINGKYYELTAAVGGSKSFIRHTEMKAVGDLLDYVFIMTYDYSGGEGPVGHHTNLYPNGKTENQSSAHQSVTDFMAAGVPASKIVLGAAFYGKATEVAGTEGHGLGQVKVAQQGAGKAKGQGGGFTKMKDTMVGKNGYKAYWDRKAKAPYLFNKDTRVFVTYDNEKSIAAKIKYIKKYDLAGIFFWEYFNDPKGYLIDAIDRKLH